MVQKLNETMNNTNTEDINWYGFEKEILFGSLGTCETGLSQSEAEIRFNKFGSNELKEEAKESVFSQLLEQFKNAAIIILLLAAVISGFIGQAMEALAIIIIVVLAALLGFYQEYQGGKAIDSLKKMDSPTASVIREGIEKVINASELVPGDLISLKAGDKIPADGRIIEAINLKTDEAALTGESLAVEKQSVSIKAKEIPLGDRKNMVFSGTTVTYGRGKAIVVKTGMETEFGKIAGLLQETESNQTPLQKNIDTLSKWFGVFSIGLAVVMSIIGLFRGYSIREMVIWGISLAVAIMPEALPAVVTISLAIGVKRMVRKRALIRKLPAVETLGATSIICSDKTGTLTKDEMTIRQIFAGNQVIEVSGAGYAPEGKFTLDGNEINPAQVSLILQSGALCNDSHLVKKDQEWQITGDPTEAAIIVAAGKAGIDYENSRKQNNRVYEIPFSSEARKMTTVNNYEGKYLVSSKGAPEVIIDSCTFIRLNGEISELTTDLKEKINSVYQEFAGQALRVIGVSTKELESLANPSEAELCSNMVFEGLLGMIDPPRPEAREAIKVCETAGIKPVMITGDHKITAMAIGKELGILKNENALSGPELEKLSDTELAEVIDNTTVFARISPAHKLKIVNTYINKGHIVAMTGDGVNDAPALKRANIGVAMGISGTDVSREAAHMILTDDNFASIVAAVEEGRGIFENIRKYLVFLVSGNIGAIIALTAALFMNLPIPLTAINILYINFIMDGLVAIALGIEPPEKGIMTRKPRDVSKGIMDKYSIITTAVTSLVIGIIVITAYLLAGPSPTGNHYASTVFFMTIIMTRIFNGFNFTSLTDSVMNIRYAKNKYVIFASLLSLLLTLSTIYTGFLNKVFSTVPLDLPGWYLVLGTSVFVVLVLEIWKKLAKRINL